MRKVIDTTEDHTYLWSDGSLSQSMNEHAIIRPDKIRAAAGFHACWTHKGGS